LRQSDRSKCGNQKTLNVRTKEVIPLGFFYLFAGIHISYIEMVMEQIGRSVEYDYCK